MKRETLDQYGDDEDGLEREDLVEVVDLVLEAGHPLPQRRRDVGRREWNNYKTHYLVADACQSNL